MYTCILFLSLMQWNTSMLHVRLVVPVHTLALWRPYLASPSTQKTDTDFAILIQIGVKSVWTVGDVVEHGGSDGVRRGKEDIKEEQSILIRGTLRPKDHHWEQILQKLINLLFFLYSASPIYCHQISVSLESFGILNVWNLINHKPFCPQIPLLEFL